MYDLIILGGGPTGLTAAVYALSKRLNFLLISRDLGGMTNYRLSLPWTEEYQIIKGEELVRKFRSQLEYLDFARRLDKVTRVETKNLSYSVATEGGEGFEARALIVATGARPQRLGVPGEKEFWMKGLCYSAVSYAPLFLEKEAAVVGGEELALRGAAELAQVARKVWLISPDPLHDSPLGAKLRGDPKVTILERYQVEEVQGKEFAERLVVRSSRGGRQEIVADGIFIELALVPNSQAVAHLVELDERGRIKIDALNRTSRPGIFAAGDVTNVFAEQVVIAIGEGAKAALSAYEYLLTH